jgi:NADH-quinone oxidoreductase subunit G
VARALLAAEGDAPGGVDPGALAEARSLARAGSVVVVVGRPSMAEDGALVAEAVQALADGLPGARFLPALRRGNVHGALDMGLAPGLLPGRVGLEAGREWFTRAWGSVPAARGRGTGAMLRAAADPAGDDPLRALVVLGADPTTDFPDRRLAERALDAVGFLVAVASAPGPVTERADVVLPAATAHERPGTTTNAEGRVSRLGQKLVPPGQAWPDWMIAAELAVHLGADLGLDSVGEVWDEVERLAPAYHGITRSVLDQPGSADGVVAPITASAVSLGRRGVAPLDPIAVPGVESVEGQGAPPRAGLAEPPSAGIGPPSDGADAADGAGDPAGDPARPDPLAGPVELDVPHVAPSDSYSLRLVASRTLYDHGAAVGSVPALASLVATTPARVNPHDLDDLGVGAGGSVRLRTETASAVVAAVPDPSLPRKVVSVDFNVPLGEGTIADLIAADAPVVEVRMETP